MRAQGAFAARSTELPVRRFRGMAEGMASGGSIAAQLDYRQIQLADAPAFLNLPTDRPRPKVQKAKGGIEQFEVDSAVVSRLQKLSRDQGVTLFMTCYSVFATLLARYTGDQDIVIGTPVANRYHHASENLIGFFVNTLPLRIRLDDNPTFVEVLSRARRVVLDAFAHKTSRSSSCC